MNANVHNWPAPPDWAILTGDIGRALIFAALACFVISAAAWFLSPKKPALQPKLEMIGKLSFLLGTVSFFGSIFCLGSLFVHNQFEYAFVFDHGDAKTALQYKIAGIWAGQEGSFLVWACTSSLFALLASFRAGKYRRWFTASISVFLATLAGILAYESPFVLNRLGGHVILPPMGAGLTPSLQNYWVVIHPPTIFSGFGSLVVAAGFGLAAMLTGDIVGYVKHLRPWAILSAAILGLGLCFGGYWAYETLGWGGFWAWDPVENVSFVPWIFELCLIHGLIVQTVKKQWHGANLILAGLPFLIFCYGTFLTRSGFLANASVHSFVEMNHTALWILVGFLVFATFSYYLVYWFKGRKLARETEAEYDRSEGLNRQKMYSSAMIFLAALGASTAVGMSVPFFMALAHKNSKVVEPHDYNVVLVWFFIPILILMAVTPFVSWRNLSTKELWQRISNICALTVGAAGLIWAGFQFIVWNRADEGTIDFPFHISVPTMPWMVILTAACTFVIIANAWRMVEMYRASKMSLGGFISHIGAATLMAGMIISTGLQQKQQVLLMQGDSAEALGYTIKYEGMTHPEEMGLLDRDNKVLFSLTSPHDSFTARPGLYYTPTNDGSQPKAQVWPHLQHRLFYDIYFTLFEPEIDVWKTPVNFKKGQTLDPNNDKIEVTYHGLRTVGLPGKVGTKFIADATVRIQDSNGVWTTYQIQPGIKLGKDGIDKIYAPMGKELVMELTSLNAADGTAGFQVHFAEPIWPITLFYKPMVILVLLGGILMFAGGVLAALYRRMPRPKRAPKMRLPIDEDLDPGIDRADELVESR